MPSVEFFISVYDEHGYFEELEVKNADHIYSDVEVGDSIIIKNYGRVKVVDFSENLSRDNTIRAHVLCELVEDIFVS
jgi:hypothetical protein